MDNRVPEASALRTFFSEQLGYLKYLINLGNGRDDRKKSQLQLADAVEQIVERVDSRIRGVSSYRKQLRNSARTLLSYVTDMVAELPPAISMDRASYVNVPFINTVFSSKNKISQLMRDSEEVEQFVRTHMLTSDFGLYAPDFYALMFLRCDEKQVYGSELRDEVIQRDVLQTAVNFQGHQLVAPAHIETDVRSALSKIIFDTAVASLNSELVKLRRSESQKERLAAALNPKQNINNPEVYLKLLSEKLDNPEKIISIQRHAIKVSKMGILLEEDSEQPANEVSFTELEVGENFKKIIVLLKFERGEWRHQS